MTNRSSIHHDWFLTCSYFRLVQWMLSALHFTAPYCIVVLDRTGQKLNTLELQTHSSPKLKYAPTQIFQNLWTWACEQVIWGSKFQCSRIFILFFGNGIYTKDAAASKTKWEHHFCGLWLHMVLFLDTNCIFTQYRFQLSFFTSSLEDFSVFGT